VWSTKNGAYRLSVGRQQPVVATVQPDRRSGQGGVEIVRPADRRDLTTDSHLWQLVAMSPGTPRRTPEADLLTEIVLLLFRVNGQLLASGDRLVEHLNLTSARWQMLGAIALSDAPRPAPQLAARMGMTRQGAQKQLDLLLNDGLVEAKPNPRHARSPLFTLTRKGASVAAATDRVQVT